MNTDELVVGEWINSAQEDLDTVSLVSQVPLLAATCFHCGQAVEKILKAYIIAKDIKLIKTHDLNDLLDRCKKHSSDFSNFEDVCNDIISYTTVRYPPDRNLTEQEMKQTIESTHEIVDFTMSKLKELGYEKLPQPTSDSLKKIIDAIEHLSQK
jgi:HEPN domain-containing protein